MIRLIKYFWCTHLHTLSLSFIVSFIQSNIVSNSKVRADVCFYWIKLLYNLNHSIFLIQSHSYFITHIHYFLILLLLFLSIWHPRSYIKTNVRDKQQKPVLVFVLFCVVKEILYTRNPLVSIPLQLLNSCTQSGTSGYLYI